MANRIRTHNPLSWDEQYARVHMACRVPAACSSRVRPSVDDGLRCADGTCRPVASGDPHVPPSVWGDHGDAAGHHHDPRSFHRQCTSFWDGVSNQVERLHRGCYWPVTPRCSCRPEGQEDDRCSLKVAHSSLQHVFRGC
jgi:hypothetical protein